MNRILLLSLAMASIAMAHPEIEDDLDVPDVPEGYKLVDIQWEVEYFPGETVFLNGTVESVHSQLLEINPNYDEDMYAYLSEEESLELDALAIGDAPDDLHERSLEARDHNICNNFPRVNTLNARDEIKYLKKVKGKPRLSPGPRECGRVACGNGKVSGAAVFWCNDNNHAVTLGSFHDITNAATVILNDCKKYYLGTWLVSGQRFHNNNINVILRHNRCR